MSRREFSEHASYLAECFDYDAIDGVLTWRLRPPSHFATTKGWRHFNTQYAGRRTGINGGAGYPQVRIDGWSVCVHRIAWVLGHNQAIPTGLVIDHINGDKSDNRLANLRLATVGQNGQNQRQKSWRLLPKGVFEDKQRGCFVGYVTADKRQVFAGRFASVEETAEAVRELRSKLHGQFANQGDRDAP